MDKTVLIIDDQENMALDRFLEELEIPFIRADSIASAIGAMKEITPSIIFLDLLLSPDAEDGITFLKRRLALPRLRKIPVLVLSGKGDLDTIYESLKFNADGYLIKPVLKSVLEEKLKEFFII